MEREASRIEPERHSVGFWTQIPIFWRFQIGGWFGHILYVYPLRWIVLGSVPGTLVLSACVDGTAFAFTLAMRAVYQRIYRRRSSLEIALIAGSLSILGAALVTTFACIFLSLGHFEPKPIFANSFSFTIFYFYFHSGLFAIWSALYFGIRTAMDSAERDILLAKTEASRQKAELQMLRAQMNPHFLFNALSSIRADLLPSQPELKETVQALGDYLRYSLEQRSSDRVPMEKEFEAMTALLAVEKARFHDEIEIACHIDPEAKPVLAPGILLQPLIENALKYGRKTSPSPRRIKLAVRFENSSLHIEVANTGKWIAPTAHSGAHGVGLDNLRQRLELLYPAQHKLDITEADGWVITSIDLPAFA